MILGGASVLAALRRAWRLPAHVRVLFGVFPLAAAAWKTSHIVWRSSSRRNWPSALKATGGQRGSSSPRERWPMRVRNARSDRRCTSQIASFHAWAGSLFGAPASGILSPWAARHSRACGPSHSHALSHSLGTAQVSDQTRSPLRAIYFVSGRSSPVLFVFRSISAMHRSAQSGPC